jgi:hypothetical protein
MANTDSMKLNMESVFSRFVAIKCPSGFEGETGEEFAYKKSCWLNNFTEYLAGHNHATKNIFLICDRDELPLKNIGTGKCDLLVTGSNFGVKKINESLKSHVLSWKRREVKHYLLSYTALGEKVNIINGRLAEGNQLSKRDAGDYDISGEYNIQLSQITSETVKNVVKDYIDVEDQGFCIEKAQAYINTIHEDEISEDIANMYNYLGSASE